MGFYTRPGGGGGGGTTNIASVALVGTELVITDTDANEHKASLADLQGITVQKDGATIGENIRRLNVTGGMDGSVGAGGTADQATVVVNPSVRTDAEIDGRADARIKDSADITGLEAWERSLRHSTDLATDPVAQAVSDAAALAPAAVVLPSPDRDHDLIATVRGTAHRIKVSALLAKPAITTRGTQMGAGNAVEVDLPAASAADSLWVGRRSDGRVWRALSDIAGESVAWSLEGTDLADAARPSTGTKWKAGDLPQATDTEAGIVTGAEHAKIGDAIDGTRLSEYGGAITNAALDTGDSLLVVDRSITAGQADQGRRLSIDEADKRWKQGTVKPPPHGYQQPVDEVARFVITAAMMGGDTDYGGQTNAGTDTFTLAGTTYTVRRMQRSGDDQVLSINLSVGGQVLTDANKALLAQHHMLLADGATRVDFASDFFSTDANTYTEYEWIGIPAAAFPVGGGTFILYEDLDAGNYVPGGGVPGQYMTPQAGSKIRVWRDLPHQELVHDAAGPGIGSGNQRTNLLLFRPSGPSSTFDLNDHARGEHFVEITLTLTTAENDFGFGTDRDQTITFRTTLLQSTLAALNGYSASDSATWLRVGQVRMYDGASARRLVSVYEAHLDTGGEEQLGVLVSMPNTGGGGETYSISMHVRQIFSPTDAAAIPEADSPVTEEAVFDLVKAIFVAGANIQVVPTDSNNRITLIGAAAPQPADGLTQAQVLAEIERYVLAAARAGWTRGDGLLPLQRLADGVRSKANALMGDARFRPVPALSGRDVPAGTPVDCLVNHRQIRQDVAVTFSYDATNRVWFCGLPANSRWSEIRYDPAATSGQAPVYRDRMWPVPRAGANAPNATAIILGDRRIPLSVVPAAGSDPVSAPWPTDTWTPDQHPRTTVNIVYEADGEDTYEILSDPDLWSAVASDAFRDLIGARQVAGRAATLAELASFQWQVDANGSPAYLPQDLFHQLLLPRRVWAANSNGLAVINQAANTWTTPDRTVQGGLRIADLPDGDLQIRYSYAGRTGYLATTWFPSYFLKSEVHDLSTVAGGQSAAGRDIRTVGGQGPPVRMLQEVMQGSGDANEDGTPNCIRVQTRGWNNLWIGQWAGELTVATENTYLGSGSRLEIWARGA